MITIIFLMIYIVFGTNYIQTIFGYSLLNNYIVISLFLSLITILISIHLIRIKLVIWRIFLQTFLSIESKLYIFFSHGYMVRIIAIMLALGCAIKILIFLCLINVHIDQYIGLYIAFVIFWTLRTRNTYGAGSAFLRGDISSLLKSYLMPFLIATTLGIFLSFWEIYQIEHTGEIKSLPDTLKIAIQSIDPNTNLYCRPLRVLIRHVYAFELMIQQVAQLKPFGSVVYFIYLVISEGAITFFGILLLGMPIREKEKNEQK